jgi:probable rRNA maturation factor
MQINVIIDKDFKGKVSARWLRGVAEQTLAAEGKNAEIEMGLVITGQEQIQQLNRQYRGKNKPTDVLSFGMAQDTPDFVAPPDGMLHLGEVIISYPQAVIQAKEHKHPVKSEVALLVVHGVLHLLGYDDEEPEQARIMRGRETAIMSQIGLIRVSF